MRNDDPALGAFHHLLQNAITSIMNIVIKALPVFCSAASRSSSRSELHSISFISHCIPRIG